MKTSFAQIRRARAVGLRVIAMMLLSFALPGAAATTNALADWPSGLSPKEIGKRVAENFVARKLDFETNPKRQSVIYPEVCAWYGSLTYARLAGDTNLQTQLARKFDFLLSTNGSKFVPGTAHVDYRVFGGLPLELYMQFGDKRYLEMGRNLADKQWEKTSEDGITQEARYWIDDMYMIPLVQVQAFRATGDSVYLDRAALTMCAYLDRLQQTNGLFFHGINAPFYWGRGNGWMSAGMAEMLRSLPAGHPRRARILEGYRKMMAALLQYQDKDGMWHQLIDHPESWEETSCTGMFAFGMITGVKCGLLDAETFGPAARKAWLALAGRLNPDGKIPDVCAGTNKGTTLEFYLNRPRILGDLHGQAPILWCASALLR